MNVPRKIMAAALAGAIALGTAAPALADSDKGKGRGKGRDRFEQGFKDWDKSFWGNEALARMITKGVIKGDAEGTVAAKRSVSRLEAAIMLVRLLNLQTPEIPHGEFELKSPFGKIKIENEHDEFKLKIKGPRGEFEIEDEDEIPAWGRGAILVALREGFLVFEGSHVSPMAPLNRQEAATMLVKAAGLEAEAQAKADAELTFKDADRISSKLSGYIAVAVEHGFVTGYEDNSFQPTKLVSRAEWAALLDRLDRKGPDVSVDGRQIKGNITAVTVGAAPSITMTTPVFPGGVTYPVDDTAVFYKNGKAVTIADIAAGESAIVNLSADRKLLMVTVRTETRQVSGKVSAFTAPTATAAGSVTLAPAAGATTGVTYAVTAATPVTLSGRTAALADILVGDDVTLTVEGSTLKAIAVKAEAVTVSGRVSAFAAPSATAAGSIVVTAAGNTPAVSYAVPATTTVTLAGQAAAAADVRVGDDVTLTVERGTLKSIAIKVEAATVSGTLSAAVPGANNALPTLTIGTTTYTVADHATLKTSGGAGITLNDLHAGDQVILRVERNVATSVTLTTPAAQVPFETEGSLLSVSTAAVAVQTAAGQSVSYNLASDVQVKTVAGTTLQLGNLVIGNQVQVKGTGSTASEIILK